MAGSIKMTSGPPARNPAKSCAEIVGEQSSQIVIHPVEELKRLMVVL